MMGWTTSIFLQAGKITDIEILQNMGVKRLY